MRSTDIDIEKKENDFYHEFLGKAIEFARNPKQSSVNGIYFKSLVAAAGVVAKQKQTRGAMNALEYQIQRDSARWSLNPKNEIPTNTKK